MTKNTTQTTSLRIVIGSTALVDIPKGAAGAPEDTIARPTLDIKPKTALAQLNDMRTIIVIRAQLQPIDRKKQMTSTPMHHAALKIIPTDIALLTIPVIP